MARGVIFVTGHAKDGAGPDWPALARTGLTLVIYMGITRLPQIAAALLAGGMSPDTLACAIENATLRNQRQVIARLATLAQRAAGLSSPAIIVVGDVVRFAKMAASAAQAKAA
jgi:uroporphyrin-III C-methyltransferase